MNEGNMESLKLQYRKYPGLYILEHTPEKMHSGTQNHQVFLAAEEKSQTHRLHY